MDPLYVEVRIGKQDRQNLRIGETVDFQYIIVNHSKRNIRLKRIDEVIPSRFKFKEENEDNFFDKNIILVKDKKIIRFHQKILKPGEILNFVIRAVAIDSAYGLKHTPNLIWTEENTIEEEKYIHICTLKFSIVRQTETIKQGIQERVEPLRKDLKEDSKIYNLIKNLGVSAPSIKGYIDTLLPINVAISTHKNGIVTQNSEEQKDSITIDSLAKYLGETSDYIIHFITGPRLIGKTAFAANLLYRIYMDKQDSYVATLSLRQKTEKISDLVDMAIKKCINKEFTFDIVLNLCKSEKKSFMLWIDVDFYKNKEKVRQIQSWITEIQKRYVDFPLKVFLILREDTFHELISDLKNPYTLVTILPYSKKQATEIANNFLENNKKIVENIIYRDDRGLFTKPPFLGYLIRIAESYYTKSTLNKEKYLEEKLIITAIDSLIKENIIATDFTDMSLLYDISRELQVESSSNLEPKLFRDIKPTAIDIETGYILPRDIDAEAFFKLNLKNTKILFISGKSGTGKTVLALKLGYWLWKQGYPVFYLDLSRVTISGRNEDYLIQKVGESLKGMLSEVVLIVDNTHLDQNKNIIYRLLKKNPWKIIAIERCDDRNTILNNLIKQYNAKKYIEGVAIGDPVLDLGKNAVLGKILEVVIRREEFVSLAKRIIRFVKEKNLVDIHPDVNIDTLAIKLAEMTKETIILMRFVILHFIENKKQLVLDLNTLNSIDFKKVIRGYVCNLTDKLRDKLQEMSSVILTIDTIKLERAVPSILAQLSIFSQYEILLPRETIKNIITKEIPEQVFNFAIKNLVMLREVIEVKVQSENESLTTSEYLYILPHPKMAEYIFEEYYETNQRKILESQFMNILLYERISLSDVSNKLLKYNKKLLFTLIENLEKKAEFSIKFNDRLMSDLTNLQEVGNFLKNISFISDSSAIKISNNHKNAIDKLLQSATIKDIMHFIINIAHASEELTREIVQNHINTIINKGIEGVELFRLRDFIGTLLKVNESIGILLLKKHKKELRRILEHENPLNIGSFIKGITRVNKLVAKDLVNEYKNILMDKKLCGLDIMSLGVFLSGIATADNEAAAQIIEKQKTVMHSANLLSTDILGASTFIGGVAKANEDIAIKIIEENKNAIEDIIKNSDMESVFTFLLDIERENENIAIQIVEIHKDTLNKVFKRATIDQIKKFIGRLSKVNRGFAEKTFELLKPVITRFLLEKDLLEISNFLKDISKGRLSMVKLLIEDYRDIIINKNLDNENIYSLRVFLIVLFRINNKLANYIIVNHKNAIRKILKKANIRDIGELIESLLEIDINAARNVIKVYEDIITEKNLRTDEITEVGVFLESIAKVHKEFADTLIKLHKQEISDSIKKANINGLYLLFKKLLTRKLIARRIIELNEEILVNKEGLQYVNVSIIGNYIGAIAQISKTTAEQIFNKNKWYIEDSLRVANIQEVTGFIKGITNGGKLFAKKAIERYKNILIKLNLSTCNLLEISEFIRSVAEISKDTAKRIVKKHYDNIGKILRKSDLREVCYFLGCISDSLDTQAILDFEKTLLELDLNNASLGAIGEVIENIAYGNTSLAEKIITKYDKKIEELLEDADISKIGSLIGRIASASEDTASMIITKYEKKIEKMLTNSNIENLGNFISRIAKINKHTANYIIEHFAGLLLDKRLDNESTRAITIFINELRKVNKQFAKKLVETHQKILTNKLHKNISPKDLGDFIYALTEAHKKIGSMILLEHKDFLLMKKLNTSSFSEIEYFICGIASADVTLANKIVDKNREIIKALFRSHSIYDIAHFLKRITAINKEVAEKIVNTCNEIIANKNLNTSLPLNTISAFIGSVGKVSLTLAMRIVEKNNIELDDMLRSSDIESIGNFLISLSNANRDLAIRIIEFYEDAFLEKEIDLFNHKATCTFIGTIAKINEKLAETILEKNEYQLIDIISELNIQEWNDFINCIVESNEDIARKIIENYYTLIFRDKEFVDVDLNDLSVIIENLAYLNKDLAKNLVDKLRNTIRGALDKASIMDITIFLHDITWSDLDIAQYIVDEHSDVIISKDLSNISITDLSKLIMRIAYADEHTAESLILKQKTTIRDILNNSSTKDIFTFVCNILKTNKRIGDVIIDSFKDILLLKDLSRRYLYKECKKHY